MACIPLVSKHFRYSGRHLEFVLEIILLLHQSAYRPTSILSIGNWRK